MNDFPVIYDASMQFYAGMSADNAKQKGIYKNFWNRDFKNLDKNKDGILSANEIMKERNRTKKQSIVMGIVLAGLALADIFYEKSKVWKFIGVLLCSALATTSFIGAHEISKQNDKYKEQIEKYQKINIRG